MMPEAPGPLERAVIRSLLVQMNIGNLSQVSGGLPGAPGLEDMPVSDHMRVRLLGERSADSADHRSG